MIDRCETVLLGVETKAVKIMCNSFTVKKQQNDNKYSVTRFNVAKKQNMSSSKYHWDYIDVNFYRSTTSSRK